MSLDNKLLSNNLPGKFVTYTQFKIPVLSISNKNSEISKIISKYKCGEFIDVSDSFKINSEKLNKFLYNISVKRGIIQIIHSKFLMIFLIIKI